MKVIANLDRFVGKDPEIQNARARCPEPAGYHCPFITALIPESHPYWFRPSESFEIRTVVFEKARMGSGGAHFWAWRCERDLVQGELDKLVGSMYDLCAHLIKAKP